MRYSGIVYTIISGFILAYFLSSILNLLLYENSTKYPKVKTNEISLDTRNSNEMISKIMERNILNLNRETMRFSNNRGTDYTPQDSTNNYTIKGYRLVGTVLGKKKMVLLKKDKDLKIISEGQEFNNYKLSSVKFDKVEFIYNGNSILLRFPKIKYEVKKSSRNIPSRISLDEGVHSYRKKVKKKEILSRAENINKLLTTVRISPYYKGKDFVGYRLGMLKKNSFLYKLGLRQGDVLKRINSEEVDSPQKAVELFSKLQDMTAVNVDFVRRGEKKSLFIELEE